MSEYLVCYNFMYPLIMVKYYTEYKASKNGIPPDGGDVVYCCRNGIDTEAKLRVFLGLDTVTKPIATAIYATLAPAGYGVTHMAVVVVTGTGTGTLVIKNQTTGVELSRGTVTAGTWNTYFDLPAGTHIICAEVV